MGYSYINENGKLVSGRAADNHFMSEHGFKRVEDMRHHDFMEGIKAGAEMAYQQMCEEEEAALRRKKIKKA